MNKQVEKLVERTARKLYYQNFLPQVRDTVISWETVSDITRGHLVEDAKEVLNDKDLALIDREKKLPKFSFSEEPPNMRFGWQECAKAYQESGYLPIIPLKEE